MHVLYRPIFALLIFIIAILPACTSEEERARMVLEANSGRFLQCEEFGREADTALKEVIDLMEKGEWTRANEVQKKQSSPSVKKFKECVDRENAALAEKFKEADISDAVANRAVAAWARDREAQIDRQTNQHIAIPANSAN